MNESMDSVGDNHQRQLATVQLVGFSVPDCALLRSFLSRPAGAGLRVVDDFDDADVLICNTVSTPDSMARLRARGASRPAIGIVPRFEPAAQFYQVAQDNQLLFSLAQAINRIRDGWVPPPVVARAPVDEHSSDVDRTSEIVDGVAQAQPAPAPDANAPDSARPPETTPAYSSDVDRTSEIVDGVAQAQPAPAPDANAPDSARPPETTPASSVAVSAGLPWQQALSVLVVDDSHFSREAVSVALTQVGFDVATADCGEAGLRAAALRRFDVALVDFEMPDMRGPEVLRKLRALGAKSPSVLLMLTSRNGAIDRLRAKFAGCDAYLTKPTRMSDFIDTLRQQAAAGKLKRT